MACVGEKLGRKVPLVVERDLKSNSHKYKENDCPPILEANN